MHRKLTIISLSALFLVLNFVLVSAFQQRQEIRSEAAATTALSFYPPSSFSNPITASVGQPFSVDLMMSPGNNKVTQLQVHIVFPKATFTIAGASFVVNSSDFPNTVVTPAVTEGANGDINFTVSNPAGIAYDAKVGTLTLVPQKVVDASNQNDGVVGFLPVTSAVSIQTGDSPTENVVAKMNQAYVFVSNTPVPTIVPLTPGTPVPSFSCLGSCPTADPTAPIIFPATGSPTDAGTTVDPTLGVGGTGGTGTGGTGTTDGTGAVSPTPCPTTVSSNSYISKNNNSQFSANWGGWGGRGGGWWRRGGGGQGGLLQFLLKLLEMLLQLLGGGKVSIPGTNPCAPVAAPTDVVPTDAPVPTDVPASSQAPAAPATSQAPAATMVPTTGASSALCGKTSSPGSGSSISCSGLTATEKSPDGYYNSTWFGCNTGLPNDPSDNCLPACSGTPECAGLDGKTCEETVVYYSANSDQYGCNAKLKVTNPSTGKSVIVRAIDAGPGCSIQKSGRPDFDMSQAAYNEIGAGGVVQVEEVDQSTPLGPIPVCQ